MNDAQSHSTTPVRKPESGARVVGVGLGLIAIAAIVVSVVLPRARELEPEDVLATWFEPIEWPFEWKPVESARGGDGSTLVRLAHPDPAPEAPPAKEQWKSPEVLGLRFALWQLGWPGPGKIRWSHLPEGARDTPPSELLVVQAPASKGAALLRRLFQGGSEQRRRSNGARSVVDGIGSHGGRRVLERGQLDWGIYAAQFAHEREFEPGGSFIDTLRVNISSETQALVLALRWPRGLPASKQRTEELLAVLRCR